MKFFVFSFAFLLGWDGVGWKYLDAILNELSRKKTIVLFCALYQFCKIAFQCERWEAPGQAVGSVVTVTSPSRCHEYQAEPSSRIMRCHNQRLTMENSWEQIINALEVEQIQSPLLPDTF